MAYEDVTKKYKKDHPKSIATGVYDVTRSKALEKKKVGEWNKKHLETKSGKGVFHKDYDDERKYYAKLNKKNGY